MKKLKLFLLPALMLAFISVSAQRIIHVDIDNTSPSLRPDGTSWQRAFSDLQHALDAVNPRDTIWIKKGIYKPSKDYNTMISTIQSRTISFIIPEDEIAIYGGFNGTETSLSQRILSDIDSNKTILSGNLYDLDSTKYAYHVIACIDKRGITFNGLSIRHGNADTEDKTQIGGARGPFIEHHYGGGLWLTGSRTITFENVEFKENYAQKGGGGIFVQETDDITFDSVQFIENIISLDPRLNDIDGGGAIFNIKSNAISFNNTLFLNNGSYGKHQGGGAIRNTNAQKISFNNTIFSSNSCVDEEDGGGAIYNKESGGIIFTNVVFKNNTASSEAGAVYNDDSNVSFTDVSFEDNSSGSGGGGAMENDKSDITFEDVTFKNNSTDGDGGAIQNWKSDLNLIEVTFEGNSAVGDGGAISNWTECNLFIVNATFEGNTSDANGGAIYSGGAKCEVIVTNGLFYNNHAGEVGGAFYTEDHSNGPSSVILTNATITKNSADTAAGGGYDDGAGNTTVRNSIINGNTAPRDADVDVPQTLILSVFNSIIDNTIIVDVDSMITLGDSLFIDAASNNFKLHSESPALNSGDSTFFSPLEIPDLSGIITDIRGDNRILGDNIDIGAYEMCAIWDSSSVTLTTNINIANHEDTMTFIATATNGGNNPVYTWYKNDIVINGETGNEYKAVAGIDIVNYDKISVSVTTEEECTIDVQVQDSIIIMITGINTITQKEAKLSIYPNPSTGEFTLDYNAENSGVVSYIVRDITGKEIYSEKGLNNNTKRFNLDLSNGLYFFTLINEKGEQETLKFIIKK